MTARYGPSTIRRSRRTRAELERAEAGIVEILEADQPMTVRGVYYRAVSRGLVPKTELGYRKIQRHVVQMRRAEIIPYNYITDSTRWQIKPKTWGSAEEMILETVKAYRRALWDTQTAYVEVWCEKDAVAGILADVTGVWDVPLMVVRGDCSDTFVYSAAQAMRAGERPVFVYYFGDHDKNGLRIPQTIERKLREFAPGLPLTFVRAAVTPEQIEELDLPTRPSKDLDFSAPCVEVDAIPSGTLRAMVEGCITEQLDGEALRRTQTIEAEERRSLLDFARAWAA